MFIGYGQHPKAKKAKPRRKTFTVREYASVIDRQEGLCACGCKEPLGSDSRDIQFDHETELWEGGTDTLDNLRAKKKRHHAHKTAQRTALRAKADRIAASDGHRRRNPNALERELSKYLEK